MKTINIGVLAHVDAGKTTLTENILYEAGVIEQIGRVDKGNTQTDSMDLEKSRGITIKATVVSFMINDLKVNLIDTPGHADFISEVERSLSILDGVILVISAVEEIQSQTKILMNSLVKLGVPVIMFMNKIDRVGSRTKQVIQDIKEKLADNVIPLYKAANEGTGDAAIIREEWNNVFFERCVDMLSTNNEALLEKYVEGKPITEDELSRELRIQSQGAHVYPMFLGSAAKGIGITELLHHLKGFFKKNDETNSNSKLSAVVFKIEKQQTGEKKAYIRLFSGSIHIREEVRINRRNKAGKIETYTDKVKMMRQFKDGKICHTEKIEAGDIGIIWMSAELQIDDVIGEWTNKIRSFSLAEPNLETRIYADKREDNHKLFGVLTLMSEEDPLMKVLKDDFNHEIYVRLFGEVQKEVIETVLSQHYGLAVHFSETRIICIEKPMSLGSYFETMADRNNPFYATIGFAVEPGEENSGIHYRLGVELGSLPLSFHKAIEDTVYEVLKQGLYGWEVRDITVTLTKTGYASPVSTAGDFRSLTPLVLMKALHYAGTEVYEPINDFELTIPVVALSKAIFKLTSAKAVFDDPIAAKGAFTITGSIPVATTEGFKAEINSYTQGEGIVITKPSEYKKITDEKPTRKRYDHNPLNRKEYLLHALHAIRK